MSAAAFRILVTGGNGFVGRHLVAALAALEGEPAVIVGSNDRMPVQQGHNISSAALDVTDAEQVRDVIAEERPTHVVHLAAVSAIPAAQSNVRLAWDVNLGGTLNVALAITERAPECRLLFCSSAEVYGGSFRAGVPLDENALLDPISNYGATKAAADLMIGQMAKRGLRAIRVRPFNHTGPGQSEDFVVASFAAQIARIERGAQEPVMKVGDLTSRRDFLDVRDVIDAYIRVLLRFDDIPRGSPINIASGRAVAISEILDTLRSMTSTTVKVERDPMRARDVDTPIIVGDPGTARRLLDWTARTTLSSTLASVLNSFRQPEGSIGRPQATP